jgi:hypothetical protein
MFEGFLLVIFLIVIVALMNKKNLDDGEDLDLLEEEVLLLYDARARRSSYCVSVT